MATRVTLKEFQEIIKGIIATGKFQVGADALDEKNVLTGLLNKVAAQVVLDGNFNDKLPELDASELPYGNIIEEWYQGLVPVRMFNDITDANVADVELTPAFPDYEDPAYSQSMDRSYFKTTLTYEEMNDAVNNPEELARLANMVLKRLYDSYAQYRYDCKKELLAKAIALVEGAMTTNTTFAATTSYTKGQIIKDNNGVYVVRKAITGNSANTIAKLLADGSLVEQHLVEVLAAPTDTATGEAFIKSVKEKVEDASFASEGNSIAGNVIGAEDGLVLFVKKGVMPSVEVDTMAGAFNKDDLAIPARVKIVEDFGSDTSKAWAILVDSRAIKLHPQYFRFGETPVNGGDYRNMFLHSKQIGYISKFAYIHVWKAE